MNYTNAVQATVDDLEKINTIVKKIELRLDKVEQTEQIAIKYVTRHYSPSHSIKTNISRLRDIFQTYMVDKLVPGLYGSDLSILDDLPPTAIEMTLRGFIDTKKQDAFNILVDRARRCVGTDPVHKSDKLIFAPFSNDFWQGDHKHNIDTIGRFLNVCLNRTNPVTARNQLLDYIFEINPTGCTGVLKKTDEAYNEQSINSKDVYKIKLFRNGKIKIYMFNYNKLEEAGKLIRNELTGQDWVLDDGTTLICP